MKREERIEKIKEIIEKSKSGTLKPRPIISTLEKAREIPDTFVILEGDYGGVVYAVIPVPMVKCSDSDLDKILNILGKDEEGNSLFFWKNMEDDPFWGWPISGEIKDGWLLHSDYERDRRTIESILFNK